MLVTLSGIVVIGTCLACRISKQHRLLCIEQNPIDIRVIHIPRANLNRSPGWCSQRRQSSPMLVTPSGIVMLVRLAAFPEGVIPDAGNAVRDRDARQAVAAQLKALSARCW